MFFEEFKPGLKVETPTITITVDDIDSFISLSGLDLPMFMDDAGARALGHEARLAPGPMVLSKAMGLMRQTGWFDQVVAVAGFDGLRFIKTMHPGDELRIKAEVKEAQPTHDPERGLVILTYTGLNQRDEIVLSSQAIYLFKCRS
jgi:acyl dehydratase